MPSLVLRREEAIQFAMEAIRHMGLTHTMKMKTIQVEVTDQQICLPDDAVRVLRISRDCPGCEPYETVQEGRYIRFRGQCATAHVIVRYYAYQTDSNGEPTIGDELEDVIFWWTLKAKLLESYLNGKLPGEQFGFVQNELNKAKRAARSSYRSFSQSEMEEMIALIRAPYVPVRNPEF